MAGMSQGGSDSTEVHQEGVSYQLVVFHGGELPCCHAEHSFSIPPVHFAASPEPLVSQSVGGGSVGEDLCGLNSHLLPSLPPLLRAVPEQVPSPQSRALS